MSEKQTNIPPKVLISIVDRGHGEDVSKIMERYGVSGGVILLGRGTASSEILNILGVGAKEKDIYIAPIPSETAGEILHGLSQKMGFSKAGRGIAFTMSLKSIASAAALSVLSQLSGVSEDKEEA